MGNRFEHAIEWDNPLEAATGPEKEAVLSGMVDSSLYYQSGWDGFYVLEYYLSPTAAPHPCPLELYFISETETLAVPNP